MSQWPFYWFQISFQGLITLTQSKCDPAAEDHWGKCNTCWKKTVSCASMKAWHSLHHRKNPKNDQGARMEKQNDAEFPLKCTNRLEKFILSRRLHVQLSTLHAIMGTGGTKWIIFTVKHHWVSLGFILSYKKHLTHTVSYKTTSSTTGPTLTQHSTF